VGERGPFIDSVRLRNFARQTVTVEALRALGDGTSASLVTCGDQGDAIVALTVPWNRYPSQTRTIGVRFRVVAEPFWFDVTEDEAGCAIATRTDERATFAEAADVLEFEGLTPQTRALLRV
jgi:hypothetical protein